MEEKEEFKDTVKKEFKDLEKFLFIFSFAIARDNLYISTITIVVL
jgi:hypothetical protein